MRDLCLLDAHRIRGDGIIEQWGWVGDGTCGAFAFRSRVDGGELHCIASSEGGWDHVSVSRLNRCPNWLEMEQVARLFFADDEWAVQYHVPAVSHINLHPYTLHWWRPSAQALPTPPADFV